MNSEFGIQRSLFAYGWLRAILTLLLVLNIFAWVEWGFPGTIGSSPIRFRSDLLIRILDVGQGTAALIETPRGRRYLIDGGPWDRKKRSGTSPVHQALQRLGVRHLDGIVISHFHNDRLEGLHAVLEHVQVDRVWENGSHPETPVFQDYLKICARRRVPRLPVKAGEELDFGPELFVAVLHPPAAWFKADKIEQHDGSVALQVRFGRTSFLLPGDLEAEAQEKMVGLGEQIRSCGLVLPISGAQKGCSPTFLDVVQPAFACISVGVGNLGGYPETPVLETLKEKKILFYRTDSHGNLEVRLRGTRENDFEVRVDRSL